MLKKKLHDVFSKRKINKNKCAINKCKTGKIKTIKTFKNSQVKI